MDVTCPQCGAGYQLRPEQIPDAGLPVKCSACQNVFRADRPTDAAKGWVVRQASGNTFQFKELTTLQRWIVERRIAANDEVSRGGDDWAVVAQHEELAPFIEVVEQAGVSCVPTVSRDHCGIMNWHGEALPVVAPHLLLGGDPVSPHTPGQIQQYLVVSGRPDASVPLGLPIDFVSGLVDGEPGRPHDNEVVVERRPVDGRVVRVIDPQRLVARAAEVIERSAAA